MSLTDEHNLYTIAQLLDGRRVRVNNRTGEMEEIGSNSPPESPVTVLNVENDATQAKDALQPPELPANVADLATIVRGKNYRR